MSARRPFYWFKLFFVLGALVFPGLRSDGAILALIVDPATEEIYFGSTTTYSGDFGTGNRTISWTISGFDSGETVPLSPGVTTVNGVNNLDAPFSLLTVDELNNAIDVTLTFTNAGTGHIDGEAQRVSYATFSFGAKSVLETVAANDTVVPLSVGPLVGDLIVSDNSGIPEPSAALLLAFALALSFHHRQVPR